MINETRTLFEVEESALEQKDFTTNIEVIPELTLEQFLALPEVPMQRDTEGRWKKARAHLKHVRSEHCVVHLVRLTKDSSIAGIKYEAGTLFRVDGNTRAYNWEREGSDYLPSKLIGIVYSYDTMDGVKQCYDTFDSQEATERNQQKVFGILTGLCNYTPISEKLRAGAIISGMNKASHFANPSTWNQTTIKSQEQLSSMVQFWHGNGCIQALDKLMTRKDKWNQPFIAAALLSLRQYGPRNKKLLEAWRYIQSSGGPTACSEDKWDGVTHIVENWKFNAETGVSNRFKDKSIMTDTKWENMDRTVPFILYHLDNWMNDVMKGKTNGYKNKSWVNVAKEYCSRTPYDSLGISDLSDLVDEKQELIESLQAQLKMTTK